MPTTTIHPVVFISYSWSSPEHEDFVLRLATMLRADSVDVKLDKWDLKEGHDKYAFMESMVTEPTVSRVLVLCDRKYKERADARSGGVGTETQIISAEIYGKVQQDKFIPIVCELDEQGQPFLPVFMAPRIYINLSSTARFADEYDKLLRNVCDRPLNQKPALGAVPAFLEREPETVALPTSYAFRAFRDALVSGKPQATGLEMDYLDSFVLSLGAFRITNLNTDVDDDIVNSIHAMRPYRDEFVAYVLLKTRYDWQSHDDCRPLIQFFERLAQMFEPILLPSRQYRDDWTENYKFLGRELFLCTAAALLKAGKEALLGQFLSEPFILESEKRTVKADYTKYDSYLRTLDEHRNRRLNLQRASISADLLQERATQPELPFKDILQADIVLAVRVFTDEQEHLQYWVPQSLVYLNWQNGPLPVVLRNSAPKRQSVLCALFGVASIQEFLARFENAKAKHPDFFSHRISQWAVVPYAELLNIAELKASGAP